VRRRMPTRFGVAYGRELASPWPSSYAPLPLVLCVYLLLCTQALVCLYQIVDHNISSIPAVTTAPSWILENGLVPLSAPRSWYPTRGLSVVFFRMSLPPDAPSFAVACALEVNHCAFLFSSYWQGYGPYRIFGTMQVDSIDHYPYQRYDMACLADLLFLFDPCQSSGM
jgi:hypothetical protein